MVDYYHNPALLKSGFTYKFPLVEFEDVHNSEVRFFAAWKNQVVRELNYYDGKEGYKWLPKVKTVTVEERVQQKSSVPYSLLSTSDGSEIIRTSGRASLTVLRDSTRARLWSAGIEGNVVRFGGWAADVKTGELPQTILIFVNRQFFSLGQVGKLCPWLLETYDNPDLLNAGFDFEFPVSVLKDIGNSEVRLFAVWKNGIALETDYFEKYPWRRKT